MRRSQASCQNESLKGQQARKLGRCSTGIVRGSIQDDRPGLDSSYAEEDYRQIVNQHIQSFGAQITHDRELIIWRERMLSDDPTSLSALGERFNVSRERVRQLEQRLKDRLRDHLKQEMGTEISVDLSAD